MQKRSKKIDDEEYEKRVFHTSGFESTGTWCGHYHETLNGAQSCESRKGLISVVAKNNPTVVEHLRQDKGKIRQ